MTRARASRRHPLCTALALTLLATVVLTSRVGAEWNWRITPYVWGAGLTTDVKVRDQAIEGGSEITMDQIIDSMDFIAMGHFEGQSGRHGFLVDTLYLNLGDDPLTKPLGGPAGGTLVAKGDLQTTIGEAAGLYNPRGDGSGFALIYGLRVFDVRDKIHVNYELGPASTIGRDYRFSSTFWDGMLGARYVGVLGEHWRANLRGDLSAGGTDLAWSADAGFAYSFNPRHTLLAGYKYMAIDLKQNDERANVKTSITLDGPYFGYQYSF